MKRFIIIEKCLNCPVLCDDAFFAGEIPDSCKLTPIRSTINPTPEVIGSEIHSG